MLGPPRGYCPKGQKGQTGGVRDKSEKIIGASRDGKRVDNSVQPIDGGGRGLGEVCAMHGTLWEQTYRKRERCLTGVTTT